jgi:hypothetical protein
VRTAKVSAKVSAQVSAAHSDSRSAARKSLNFLEFVATYATGRVGTSNANDKATGPMDAGRGFAMSQHIHRSGRSLRTGAVAAVLLLMPMFVADADSSLEPAQTIYIENLLGQHAARYMLGPYARVPLQCAHEMHGA